MTRTTIELTADAACPNCKGTGWSEAILAEATMGETVNGSPIRILYETRPAGLCDCLRPRVAGGET